jgi:hypothetical protein
MDKLKRRAALQLAYRKDLDAFLCFYSRLPLDMEDHSSPFWI